MVEKEGEIKSKLLKDFKSPILPLDSLWFSLILFALFLFLFVRRRFFLFYQLTIQAK